MLSIVVWMTEFLAEVVLATIAQFVTEVFVGWVTGIAGKLRSLSGSPLLLLKLLDYLRNFSHTSEDRAFQRLDRTAV